MVALGIVDRDTVSRFLVEQLETVEIAIANDRSTSAASYRQSDFSRVL